MKKSILFILLAVTGIYSQSIVQIVGSGTVNGKAAAPGMQLSQGDTIRADRESLISVRLSDGTGVAVKNETVVVLETFIPQKKKSAAEYSVMVLKGYILAIVKKGNEFHVKTPSSTAAVRGTVLFARADDAGTYHCTCTGHVEHTTKGGAARSVEATHHKGIMVDTSGRINEAGMEDHTDEEIASLVTLLR